MKTILCSLLLALVFTAGAFAQNEGDETGSSWHGSAIMATELWSGSGAATGWSTTDTSQGWWVSVVVGQIDMQVGSATFTTPVRALATKRGSIIVEIPNFGSIDIMPSDSALRVLYSGEAGELDPHVNDPKSVRLTYTSDGVLTFHFKPATSSR